jgi:hypothetical protein
MAARPTYLQLLEELHRLQEICAFYANDEDGYNKGASEPYGSIPTEVGILARDARERFKLREMVKTGELTRATMAGAARERCDRRTAVIHLIMVKPDPAVFLGKRPALCGARPSLGWSDWLPADGATCPTCQRKLERLRSSIPSA